MQQVFVIDCFADRVGTGAPAAVCLLDGQWPATDWMQQVATELNLPATAFVRSVARDTDLRWFGPRTELELCASGTLAAAHVLSRHGGCGSVFTFATRTGTLTACCGSEGWLSMEFPADPPWPILMPDGLAAALGATPVAVARGRLDLLVELESADAVRELRPNLTSLAALDARGVIVTADGCAAPSGVDFVSRFFAPGVGIDEDPVTGSTHCTLGAYWAPRWGKTSMLGAQLSARGGQVGVRVSDDRVELSGRTMTSAQLPLVTPPR